MNIKTKIKFLKVRQRADRFELKNLAQADELDELRDKINELARERGAADADMIRRHQAELDRVRGDSTDTRQKIQRLENAVERAVEALDHIAPLWHGVPMSWRETLLRQDLWYAWRGQALRDEAETEVHSDTQGTSSVVYGAGGAGGQGGANFGAVASSIAGSGGIVYGVDPMALARSWVSGTQSGGRTLRTDAERRAEQ